GPTEEVAEALVKDPRVEAVSFTGSVEVGKRIAATAGYKKLCLELGGNCPLIVCADADLDLAARLAAEGSFRNSGQRCTAVNRIIVEEPAARELTERLVERARDYRCGDPLDPETRVGTVIGEASAARLEALVRSAVQDGARLLLGGSRRGALFAPAVLAGVPRDAEVVAHEAFGPIAAVVTARDLDDAIALANATPYGLSAGIVTRSLEAAVRAVKEVRAGTVNVNEVPGYRLESTPFGGVKDSGLGVKEGVIEAIRFFTWVKTFSLPW
ncbi:MAG: aldehyde dehydrogenase family protein, partial [Planctomycetes bacterium]|nr:aldehyde dehydrogenase family protein [Planctomycetota bacterium]